MILITADELVKLQKSLVELHEKRSAIEAELERLKEKINYDFHQLAAHVTSFDLKYLSLEDRLDALSGSP